VPPWLGSSRGLQGSFASSHQRERGARLRWGRDGNGTDEKTTLSLLLLLLDGNAASGRQRRLWTPTPPLDGNAASGCQRRLWTPTPPLDANAASGRQRRLWTPTPPLDANAASGRQRRLWTPTPPLDGNAASGRQHVRRPEAALPSRGGVKLVKHGQRPNQFGGALDGSPLEAPPICGPLGTLACLRVRGQCGAQWRRPPPA